MEYIGVFQGGGMKGLAYIGALMALEENGYYCKKAAGSSMGAVFAGLVASGYKAHELLEIIDKLDFNNLVKKDTSKIKGFILEKGIHSMEHIENELSSLLRRKNVYTFNELITNNETRLKVTGSIVGSNKTVVFPDSLKFFGIDEKFFSVARAITMSATFPVYFKPLKLFDNYIFDGGVTNNFPYEVFNYNEKDLVIGFRILDNDKKYIPPFINIINIKTNGSKILNFKMNHSEKIKLIEKGYLEGLKMVNKLNSIYKSNF